MNLFRKIIRKNKLIVLNNSPLRKSRDRDFIFIHINKTGGTSIAKTIGLPFKRHLTAKDIIKLIGKDKWMHAYKFTVVRNPWDKVVSHYKYRVKTNQTNMAESKISFKDWVRCTYGKEKNDFYFDKPKMFQQQVEWLRDYEDNIVIDKIIKFDRLNEGYKEVAETLNLERNLPHLNKTKQNNYKSFYDDETKEIIADWFKEDIELFGYTFGE